MSCDEFAHVVGDLLEPDGGEHVLAAELHAMDCGACDALLRDLRQLQIRGGQLPRLQPGRDLWPGIADRIGTPVIAIADHQVRRQSGTRDEHSTSRGATAPERSPRRAGGASWRAAGVAAALLLAAASITFIVTARHAARTIVADVQSPVPSAHRSRTSRRSAEEGIEAVYDGEIAGLEAVAAERLVTLDPVTAAVIGRNLSVLGNAIDSCERALVHDPASPYLIETLTNAYDSKVALLRTTANLSDPE